MQRRNKKSDPSAESPQKAPYSAIPSVSRLLESKAGRQRVDRWGHEVVTALLRRDLDGLREELGEGGWEASQLERVCRPKAVFQRLDKVAHLLLRPRPRPVINATGVIVHTNLGRSVLSAPAAQAVAEALSGYLDLEYDLGAGRRGSRQAHLAPLIQFLFPGFELLALNNNAAATMLALRALAKGKEVLVSRGELVEIGGSFRIPDILEVSGAKLKEVGTTNRTRIEDYRKAIGRKTGALLKVHTSNFRIVGFTEDTKIESLAELSKEKKKPLIVDWGSGDLIDLAPYGIHDEMPVRQILEAGADVVTFSGDKLLGGPQAGLILARPELMQQIRSDPFARACRLDRILTAALHATLRSYVLGRAQREIPTLQMLAIEPEQIKERAKAMSATLKEQVGTQIRSSVKPGVSKTGGGTSPMGERPTWLWCLRPRSAKIGTVKDWERRLRLGDPAVVATVRDDTLQIDLRTVSPSQEAALGQRIVALVEKP